MGGGVCVYTKLSYKTLRIFSDSKCNWILQIIWKTKRKPVISVCVYLTTNLRSEEVKNYLDILNEHILEATSMMHRNAKILLYGDFNKYNLTNVITCYNLLQVVNFSTRKDAFLVLIVEIIQDEEITISEEHRSVVYSTALCSSKSSLIRVLSNYLIEILLGTSTIFQQARHVLYDLCPSSVLQR